MPPPTNTMNAGVAGCALAGILLELASLDALALAPRAIAEYLVVVRPSSSTRTAARARTDHAVLAQTFFTLLNDTRAPETHVAELLAALVAAGLHVEPGAALTYTRYPVPTSHNDDDDDDDDKPKRARKSDAKALIAPVVVTVPYAALRTTSAVPPHMAGAAATLVAATLLHMTSPVPPTPTPLAASPPVVESTLTSPPAPPPPVVEPTPTSLLASLPAPPPPLAVEPVATLPHAESPSAAVIAGGSECRL